MSARHVEGVAGEAATPTADAALVAGLRAGDRAAVAELYDRYGERLLGFCHGMLRDGHEAADALHDTILVAADRIEQLRDPERLRPWLYAIARTQSLARLRRRERTVLADDPTELAGGRPVTGDAAPDDEGARAVEGGEAGALVWDAAEGLDEGDRVLLELQLRQGLAGAELAAAAGVRPGQISMATGRMRDRLERALGALLVARHARRDCEDLDAILRDWDGRLTVLVRKRVARHVERCDVCSDRRAGLVAPLGSLAVGGPVVLAGADLRTRILAGVDDLWGPSADAAPDVAGGWDDEGFPRDPRGGAVARTGEDGAPTGAGRRRAALASAAVVLVLLGALVAWRATAGGGDEELRAEGASATAADGAPATTAPGLASDGAPGPGGADQGGADQGGAGDPAGDGVGDPGKDPSADGPAPTTTPTGTAPVGPPPPSGGSPLAGPTGPAAGPTAPPAGPEVGPGAPPVTAPPVAAPPVTAPPAPTPTPPPNPAPVVSGLSHSPGAFQTTCNPDNDSAEASVVVTDTGGTLTVRLFHSGPGGGAGTAMALSGGRWRGQLQGFAAPGSHTWWVTASDGTHTTTSATRAFQVDPCPG